jgi:hypothetical protein
MLKKSLISKIFSSHPIAQISVVNLGMIKQELQSCLQFMTWLLPKKLQTYRKRDGEITVECEINRNQAENAQ